MDTGSKTLTQLSEEGKETKFVTLDVGSKMSGYTKDYLERLCRLNKVEYKLWNNGQFAIELESLLRETHTILLSYEGLTFVDKGELTEPPPVPTALPASSALKGITSTIATDTSAAESAAGRATRDSVVREMPRYAKIGGLSSGTDLAQSPMSFIGRAVVSDPLHPEMTTETASEVHIPIAVEKASASAVPAAPPAQVVHIPITSSSSVRVDKEIVPPQIASTETEHAAVGVVVAPKPADLPNASAAAPLLGDDWDALLLGGSEINTEDKVAASAETQSAVASALPITPSQYRPIQTSVDATVHHDDAPLFPLVGVGNLGATGTPRQFVPPPDQKVVVFDPESFPGHKAAAVASTPLPTTPVLGAPPALRPIVRSSDAPLDPKPTEASSVLNGVNPPVQVASVPPVVPHRPPVIPSISVMPRSLASPGAMPRTLLENAQHLPEQAPEQHLSIAEPHPLMKSVGFNTTFAVMLFASAVVLLGGVLAGRLPSSVSFVAGVGASQPALRPALHPDAPQVPERNDSLTLPFSDDLQVTQGTASDTVIVQPVFRSGRGNSYEYGIVPIGAEATSGSK